LGGAIRLESEVGRGSAFSLVVPREHESARPRARKGFDPAGSPRTRLLMIDDEAVSHYLIEQSLSADEYDLVAMTHGREALALAWAERPDIILLDLVMPYMTGFEVLEALRTEPSTRSIPVIVYTSKALLPRERELIASHGAKLLMKDAMTPDTLRAMLEKILADAKP
jgi:CheY-like chemotaxis protein